ncbi:hypothetical protein ACYSNW_17535 [Enterococcus sp. LJL99]
MKKTIKFLGVLLISALIGGIIGFFLGQYITFDNFDFYDFLLLIISAIFFYIFHIIIHEAGHGVFGKLTGYKMVSFRVFSFMWVWENKGSISFKRLKVPGTLGQCLMAPPNYQKGKFPFRLYLLGGVLMNLIFSLIVGVFFLSRSPFAALFVLIGIFIFLTNLIPFGFNDGMSLKIASSSENQQYLLYLQFEVNYQLTSGKTYLDLPKEYFCLVPIDKKTTYFNDYQKFLLLGLYLENKDWEDVGKILNHLWQKKTSLVSIYQIELKKELLFYLCLTNVTDNRILELWQDKMTQVGLKQPLAGNARIKACYEYFINRQQELALKILYEARKQEKNAPNLGDFRVEMELNHWLESIILNKETVL